MSYSNQQQLFVIFSRLKLNPSIIPPFKMILPLFQLMCPIRLFTSMCKQITFTTKVGAVNNLYEALVFHLQNQEGNVDLNATLNLIYNEKIELENSGKVNQNKNAWNFRICIIGEEVISWDVVMKFKLKNVVIDTFGQNKRLQQISFATGGISRSSSENLNIIRLFSTVYGLSTECRKKFNFLTLAQEKTDQNMSQSIQFTVDCICCQQQSKQLSNQCYLCSQCLSIHCSNIGETCTECKSVFENVEIKHKPC